MTPHNPVLPALVGGQRFALALRFGELQRLEAETATPLEKLFWAISGGEGKLAELKAVLRLGLAGGGLSEAESEVTAQLWMEQQSLVEMRVLAAGLLMHALRRASPDEVDFEALGKALGEDALSGARSPQASSTGPNITATPPPPSGGRRKRSGRSRSGSTTAP